MSPTEIEETLLKHPEKLVVDVTVAGVSGGRTADERVPRAWVVLSSNGKTLDATKVVARLDAWVREALSRYKWLRGGIAVVNQVRPFLSSIKTCLSIIGCRYLNRPRERCCAGYWWTSTKPSCDHVLRRDCDLLAFFWLFTQGHEDRRWAVDMMTRA